MEATLSIAISAGPSWTGAVVAAHEKFWLPPSRLSQERQESLYAVDEVMEAPKRLL